MKRLLSSGLSVGMLLLSLLVFENLAGLENPLPGRQGAAASLMGREVGPRWLGGGLGTPSPVPAPLHQAPRPLGELLHADRHLSLCRLVTAADKEG